MPVEDGHIDGREFERRIGNDTPPLFSYVRDEPYSRGTLTSVGRTASLAYQRFLLTNKHKEVRDERR